MPSFQTFKDLSVTFKKHPVTDDLIVVKDKAAIAQAIQNLLFTRIGERMFQPNLGSRLLNLLFEPLDNATAALISLEIREVLERYEPRISVLSVLAYPDSDENGFQVELSYSIVGRQDTPVAVEFFLERTR
jgi:phage baseplate assembly protein W